VGLQSEFDSLLDSPDPLSGLDSLIWDNLTAGSRSFEHPWRLGSLSTIEVAADSSVRPQSRTVVLRHADSNARLVECHTDVRSGKVGQLNQGQSGAEASWLFYEHGTGIQLRLNGLTHVIDGDEADRAWRATPLRSRAAYLSIPTPGEPTQGPKPPDTSDRQTTLAESERGRVDFRIVRTRVDTVDLVYLRRGGHVRAKLSYPTDSAVTVTWVVP
jgi:pyridoxamine 5'-phosphate oxidase